MKKLIAAALILLYSTTFGAKNEVVSAPNIYGLYGHIRTFSAKTLGNGKLSAGVSGDLSLDKNKLYRQRMWLYNDESVNPVDTVDGVREIADVSTRAFISIGISDYFDFNISMPFYLDLLTTDGIEPSDVSHMTGWGQGDLELRGKLQYPPYKHSHVFDMALLGAVTFPTGDDTKGFIPKESYYAPKEAGVEGGFYTAWDPTYTVMMLWTLDLNELWDPIPLEFNVNYGMLFTHSGNHDNSFLLNASVAYNPHRYFALFCDFSGQTRLSQWADGFDLERDPLILSPGFSVKSEQGVSISMALDYGGLSNINQDPSTLQPLIADSDNDPSEQLHYYVQPTVKWGFSAQLSWNGFLLPQDDDLDGLINREDVCPNQAEDFDGYEDHDGCPEADNDLDGIFDVKDNCPGEPEDMDGFEDTDGCPELDNDKDGYLDAKDACPDEPEDLNGFEDDDGCPDGTEDSDKDGVNDVGDQCPKRKEDRDGFEDDDGCPDKDNDRDGIEDKLDRCPDAAEVMNGFEDEDGCPDRKPKPMIERRTQIVLHGVNFRTGSTDLTEDSHENLDEVAETLKENLSAVIEIRGYTDNKGAKSTNLKLSKRRARSVVKYLRSVGVPKKQLRSKGYGPKNPIATNRTASGRQKNRRIEMYRVK
ncbi:MAG: OmpA family protein [Fibrobacterales bacterium]